MCPRWQVRGVRSSTADSCAWQQDSSTAAVAALGGESVWIVPVNCWCCYLSPLLWAGIAKAEGVSLLVPVSAPVASLYDSLAAEAMPPGCL